MVIECTSGFLVRGLGTGLCVRTDVRSSNLLGHALFDGRAGGYGGELGGSGCVRRPLADAFAVLHKNELKKQTEVRIRSQMTRDMEELREIVEKEEELGVATEVGRVGMFVFNGMFSPINLSDHSPY